MQPDNSHATVQLNLTPYEAQVLQFYVCQSLIDAKGLNAVFNNSKSKTVAALENISRKLNNSKDSE